MKTERQCRWCITIYCLSALAGFGSSLALVLLGQALVAWVVVWGVTMLGFGVVSYAHRRRLKLVLSDLELGGLAPDIVDLLSLYPYAERRDATRDERRRYPAWAGLERRCMPASTYSLLAGVVAGSIAVTVLAQGA